MRGKIYRTGFLVILSSVLLFAASCGTPDEKKMAFYSKGQTLFEAKDFTKARLEFKNAIQIDTKFAKAYYMLGRTELSLGNGKAGFGYISKAVQLKPDLIEARLILARMFLGGKALDRAEKQVDKVLKLYPDNADALVLKATLYFVKKNYESAGKILEKIDKSSDKKPDFYLLYASFYNAIKKKNTAGEVLHRGLKHYPDSLVMTMALAKYYAQKQDLKNVEHYLKKAVVIAPKKIDLKLNLAWLYFKTKRDVDANNILNKIIESDPENDKNIMAVAVMFMQAGKTDQSIEIVKKGIKRKPATYGYTALLTEIYLKTRHIKKAEDVLRKYLSLGDELLPPDMIKAKVNLVKLLLLLQRPDEAETLIDQVLTDDPKNIDAHYLKGRMYLVKKDGDKAILNFRTVIDEHPEYLNGYIGLADAYALNKDYDLALDILKKAIKKAPNSAKILKGMVRVNILKKDPAAVEDNLKQLVSLDPYNIGSIAGLGDFYLSMNRYNEAIAQYKLIKGSKKASSLRYLKTAQAMARQGKLDNAIDELEAGYKKTAEPSVFLTSLGKLYLRQGQIDDAVTKFKEALAIDKNNRLAWLTLGNIYESRKENEKAMDLYRRFLEIHPDSWAAANNLAFLLSESTSSKKSLKEAAKLAQKAETLNPGSPLVQDTLGWIYYKLGDIKKAEAQVSLAIGKMPSNNAICYHFGVICHDLGKKQLAKENLEKAIAGRGNFSGREHAVELYDRYYK